ncbi:hypothetical protein P4H66_23510 [Paenibacillus dokdonensis]|uniref:Uncharacterized protein n=1 Tax=Paenibacillus dokdonensis TaxID=2567944 RepID=A0ABU6GU76_9BACL|nr:hypothetical protein [Paenibacillus dokdonensis]MEC0242783.1 hypothetical protein [Paenibacillus dokdonensis]
MDREVYKGIPDGLGIYTHDVITGKMTVNQARERLTRDGMIGGHIEALEPTSTVGLKLKYLGLLEKLHQEGPDGYRKLIANRIATACDCIEKDLGMGSKDSIDIAELKVKLSVDVPPEFGDEVKQLQRELATAGSKLVEAAKNLKVSVS